MEVGESWLSGCVEGIATAGLSSQRSPTGSDSLLPQPGWWTRMYAHTSSDNVKLWRTSNKRENKIKIQMVLANRKNSLKRTKLPGTSARHYPQTEIIRCTNTEKRGEREVLQENILICSPKTLSRASCDTLSQKEVNTTLQCAEKHRACNVYKIILSRCSSLARRQLKHSLSLSTALQNEVDPQRKSRGKKWEVNRDLQRQAERKEVVWSIGKGLRRKVIKVIPCTEGGNNLLPWSQWTDME